MTVSCFPLPLAGTILDVPAAVEGTATVTPQGANWIDPDPAAGAAFGQLLGTVLETLSEEGIGTGTGTGPSIGRPPIPMRTETVPEPAESGDAKPETPETDPDPAIAVAVPVSGVLPFAEPPLDAQPTVQPSRLAPEKPASDSWPFDVAHRVSLPDAAAGDESSDLPPASSGTRDVPAFSPAFTEDPGNADVPETAGVASLPTVRPPASSGPLNVEPPVEWPPQKDRPPESSVPPIVTAPAVSFDSQPPTETGRTAAQRPASRPMITVRTAPAEEPPVADAKPAFSMRIVGADRDQTADTEAPLAPPEQPAGAKLRRATQVDTLTLLPEDPIAIAAAPAARPGRPVQAETVRADQPEAEIDRTEPPEVAVRRMPETYRGAAARQISLRVAEGGEERVEVRVAEQSGELRVDVRARNEGLAGRLRDGLPELVGRLQENGLEAEVWRPSGIDASKTPARRDELPVASQERNPGGERGSGWQQGEEGGRRRHQQDGQSQSEVFDPYFQLRNENGQE